MAEHQDSVTQTSQKTSGKKKVTYYVFAMSKILHQPQTGEKRTMNIKTKNKLITPVALALLTAMAFNTNSIAGVAEVATLVPVAIPAKVGSTAGVKFVGIPVARPGIYEGTVTTLVPAGTGSGTPLSTVVTDSTLTTQLISELGASTVSTARVANDTFATADNQYLIEITSGPNIGLVKTVSAITSGGATVLGGFSKRLDVGTTYVLRKDWTIGSLLGTDSAGVAASGIRGGLVSSSDHIGVIRNARLELYYWNNTKWLPTSGAVAGVAYEHVRVPMSGGFYFKRNTATSTTVYLSGIYRPHRLQALLEGISGSVFTVSTPNYVDTTLAQTGLHRYVKSSSLVSAADELRIISANGTIASYFNAGSGTGYTSGFWNGSSANAPSWRSTASGNAAGSANSLVIPAGSAIMIKKSGADARLIGIDPAYTQ
jgi:hypothetical protein